MKSFKLITALLALVMFVACQEHSPVEDNSIAENPKGKKDGSIDILYSSNVAHYEVTLVDGYPAQVGDNYVWIWKIKNPNPSRTNKDLSHWGLSLGSCATSNNVVTAAYSCNGTNWTYFTPSYQSDPSTRNCNSIGSTLKFDYGTSGRNYSYYMLVLNQEFQVDESSEMVVKYGNNCTIGTFPGIGCEPEEEEEEDPCYGNDGYAWAGDQNFYSTSYYIIKYYYISNPDVTYDLHDSLGTVVGSIHVHRSGTTVSVDFTTTGNWYLRNTYMHYSQVVSTIPKSGAYVRPSLFTYQATHNPYVQEYSYTFQQGTCSYIYIAVYADITQQIECD